MAFTTSLVNPANLDQQDFFETTLKQAVSGSSDTNIYLNTLPTPSEGFLVIEPTSASAREIIYYTSKGSDYVTCPSAANGRGVGSTTAQSHSSGATVRMGDVAEYWRVLRDGYGIASGSLPTKKLDTNLQSGWFDPNQTWTYASATTFTISGDQTGIYQPGDKLRWKQGGGYKYGWVKSASYSAPNTTITLVGTNLYTLTNATITDNYYSKWETPVGFPKLTDLNARAYRNAAGNISNNTIQKMNWDAASYNPGGYFDVTTNNRYDVKVDGYYQVNALVALGNVGDGSRTITYIRKNGSDAAVSPITHGGMTTNGSMVSDVVKCAAGDYLETFVYHNTGSTLAIANTAAESWMSVAFVGLVLT